jgi:hypothetical protein
VVGHTWVTSCIVGVCWTAGVMSASTVGAPPAHRRVHIVVLDAQTNGGFRPFVSLDRPLPGRAWSSALCHSLIA